MGLIRKFLANESGATAIEYSMIGAIISIVILSSVTIMGTKMNTHYTAMGSALK